MSYFRRWSRSPVLLAGGLFLICALALVSRARAATGGRLVYALDDTYTHMAMADTLAFHGVWGCTPYRFASGSSSPLWVVLLTIFSGFGHVAPLLLNVGFGLATLALCDAWLRGRGAPTLLRFATLAGLVIVLPMPAMVLLGMEHQLHVFLTLAFVACAVDLLLRDDRTRAALRRLALLGALLGASRYEGFFLVALVCAALVVAGRWRAGVALGAAAAVPATVLGGIAALNGSPFLPNPLLIKAGGLSASVWDSILKPIGQPDVDAMLQSPQLLWLSVAAIVVAGACAWRAGTVRSASVLLPLLLVLAIALHLHYAFSSAFHAYRYDAYLLAFALIALAVILTEQLAAVGSSRARHAIAAAVMLAATLALGDVRSALTAPNEVESAGLTFREHHRAAEFVSRYFSGQTVAVNDIGVMAYRADADVVDMFGLCDVGPVLARRRPQGYEKAEVHEWATARGARIALVQLTWAWVVPRIPDEWRRLARVRIRPNHEIGIFAIAPDIHDADVRGAVAEFFDALGPPGAYEVLLY